MAVLPFGVQNEEILSLAAEGTYQGASDFDIPLEKQSIRKKTKEKRKIFPGLMGGSVALWQGYSQPD
ncbi:MAG: hypothetical protein N3E45_04020 [Oscillatoriaceae bacterium SKW80]|nr:hypothetical protein [Oscillatoriaceae bacterium SKYG93]MCX8119985.1 hypothetical protein [Oscillatoriaceae bacterium SKW80]MDW8454146.1 hypothetical protein [Oscillatoriaceae cyanobacterium SKYGB_i_bin93]HIK29534.1 hypothetical protein [Oscillatoriaceae cyanobacterium M7585_C2015_266]